MKLTLVLLITTLIFSGAAMGKLLRFNIDKAHSSIEFSVKHLGLVPVKGRFTKFEGYVDYHGKSKKGKVLRNVYIKIDADSINTDNPDRDAHLRSKDFFHVRNDVYDIVKKNRYIEFWAKNYSLGSPQYKGKLKILKTKRNITLNIQSKMLKGKKRLIGIMAQGEINRQKFGLNWQKPGSNIKNKLAGKLVGDQVKLDINLVFLPPF